MEETGKVDFEEFAELVIKAKGPNRTMQQFATEIGTNPSTLSRIVNKKNTGPSAEALLKLIAEHADSDSEVTLEMLMKANGMEKKQESRMDWIRENERVCIDAIANSLKTTNAMNIQREYQFRTGNMSSWYFDFAADVDGIGLWCFDIKLWNLPDNRKHRLPAGFGNTRNWLMMTMAAFYSHPEIKKITMVVQNAPIYEQLAKEIVSICIKDVISVALVDTKEMKIVAEQCSCNEDGEVHEAYFRRMEGQD